MPSVTDAKTLGTRFSFGILICLGHVGLVALLVLMTGENRRRIASISEEALQVFLFEDTRSAAQVDGPKISAEMPLSRPQAEVPLESTLQPEAPLSGAPIALPRIDWYGEAARVAEDAAARDGRQDSLHALDSHPKGIEPPPKETGHRPGDTEHFEGGGAITWINDRCYYSTQPPALGAPNATKLDIPICTRRERDQIAPYRRRR